jgi:hypothetical protein
VEDFEVLLLAALCRRGAPGAAVLGAAAVTLPWRSAPPLAPDLFARVHRQAIFDCCKWDPQVEDVATLSPVPLLLELAAWEEVAATAESLAMEVIAAEAELAIREKWTGAGTARRVGSSSPPSAGWATGSGSPAPRRRRTRRPSAGTLHQMLTLVLNRGATAIDGDDRAAAVVDVRPILRLLAATAAPPQALALPPSMVPRPRRRPPAPQQRRGIRDDRAAPEPGRARMRSGEPTDICVRSQPRRPRRGR